eukprot:TRINITY_DN11344_c0_g1_i1.p1 TRINITY_DN11344_c0_g1~~TRINITY_DN11344_c0_g1_i1.p1  ORF type:complete len:482 (-),score=209.62 TRINITY_DN11344_c0_g1_i1:10-1455(-)
MGITLTEDSCMELGTSPLQCILPAALPPPPAAVAGSSPPTAAVNPKQLEVKKKRRKKKSTTLVATTFKDLYTFTGEVLGEGSYGKVVTCKNVYTNLEYAVKIIEKKPGQYNRSKVLKEIDIYHLCRDHPNILHMIEYFEEEEYFYLIFEKINGGPLLHHIQDRVYFTEAEAATVIASLADALKHLHKQGIAHRDLKPDNILCVKPDSPCPVKLCDFDLCSKASIDISTPRLLTPVGSVEYMAPEVVDVFITNDYIYDDDDDDLSYNKKCDLWSLGIIAYILLCGYVPFNGRCGNLCGWDRGENCDECQFYLFGAIKEGHVEFHEKYWSHVSAGAKDLIRKLLVTNAEDRLDAAGVLAHPWIQSGGSTTTSLCTPSKLAALHGATGSIKDLEHFASRAMAVNRAYETEASKSAGGGGPVIPLIELPDIPWQRETLSLSPLEDSHCSLLERRRRSKLFQQARFASIDEMVLEKYDTDTMMKAI